MKNSSIISILVALVMVLGISRLSEAQDTDCAQNLISCANDLNTTTPSTTCCNSIKQAVATQLTCLCNLYKTPGLLASFGVNVTQALGLTTACGVPVSLNKCDSTAPSPSGSNSTPPAVPGNDKDGADRMMAWTGITTFLLFWASTMIY